SFRGRPRRPEDGGVIPIASSDGSRRILVCAVPFLTPHSFARFDRPGETTGGFTAGIKRIYDAYNAWLEDNIDPATDKVVWAVHRRSISSNLRRDDRSSRSLSASKICRSTRKLLRTPLFVSSFRLTHRHLA